MSIQSIESEQEFELFCKNNNYILFFSTKWCPSCELTKQQLEKFNTPIGLIDIEDLNLTHLLLANKITEVPCLLVINNNKLKGVHFSAQELTNALQSL